MRDSLTSRQKTRAKRCGHSYISSNGYTHGALPSPDTGKLVLTEIVHSGECAEHFGKILEKYPPQVSSRSAAAAWGCYVHNIVNRRLHKDEFDCSKIGDFYDCGCAEDEAEGKGKSGSPSDKPEMSEEQKEKLAGQERKADDDVISDKKPLEVEQEG